MIINKFSTLSTWKKLLVIFLMQAKTMKTWIFYTKQIKKFNQKNKLARSVWRQDSIICICIPEISESLDGVSVSTSFAQSRLVSVSTSIKFPGLDESRSRHLWNSSVSMSLGLDIQEISQSRWVSVSTSKKFYSLDESRSQHPRNFSVSMSLGLDIHEIS